jgi:hypothetical protein
MCGYERRMVKHHLTLRARRPAGTIASRNAPKGNLLQMEMKRVDRLPDGLPHMSPDQRRKEKQSDC